jgi:N-acetylglucosaminyldiphosphoundecaprenol N-acetyl-beta-D-mannosaminyltransferase
MAVTDSSSAATGFLGVDFATGTAEAMLDQIVLASAEPGFRYVVTPNVDHLVRLHRHDAAAWHGDFAAAVDAADWRLNDSRILAKLAMFSGIKLTVITGSDLTRSLITEKIRPGMRLALIGGEVREALWLKDALPGCTIDHLQPPMGVLQSIDAQDAILQWIEAIPRQFVFLAIGAPQSEILARRLKLRGKASGVALCIGASIEFLSGAKNRAPRWIQALSLEWLYRLISEPRRMWRRYLVQGPKIFGIWWQHRKG